MRGEALSTVIKTSILAGICVSVEFFPKGNYVNLTTCLASG